MKFLMFLAIFLSSFASLPGNTPSRMPSNLIKVAVIDTGLDVRYTRIARLCPGEHKDFTGEGLQDFHGHGTNITGLIVNNADSSLDYCIVLIKAYGFKSSPPRHYVPQALKYALSIGANVINLSGGGAEPIPEERLTVAQILNKKITLIVAAGNERSNLDLNCKYYPACYDSRIYVIGTNDTYSNFGSVVDLVLSGNNKSAFGQTFSGTSQATAIFTGSLLKRIAIIKETR